MNIEVYGSNNISKSDLSELKYELINLLQHYRFDVILITR